MARKVTTATQSGATDSVFDRLEPDEYKAFIYAIADDIEDKEKSLPQRFGRLVKRLRETKGLSIRDVEKWTSLSASYLYQIERGIRKVPSVNAIVLLSKVYGVPFASLMAAAKYVETEEAVLYYDQLERAFQSVCHDKRFKYSPLVDVQAVPADVKRLVVEMYQHFTGVNLLERVDDQLELRRRAKRKLRGEAVEPMEGSAASSTSGGES